MPIEEGERYRLGNITFKNNKAITNNAALRSLFPMKDGDIFSREKIAKGLENLRKAYGEAGYINFTSVPDTKFDDEKKTVNLEIDVDEGKQFYVRRIEFQGNTTTRDKVIRREMALEEGQIYNSRLLGTEPAAPEPARLFRAAQAGRSQYHRTPSRRKGGHRRSHAEGERKREEQHRTARRRQRPGRRFRWPQLRTNNFLGLGETLSVQASLGSRQRDIVFGFTEPYLFDRPIQAGFNVYTAEDQL